MTACNPINKTAVARAFNRAASGYDKYAKLQQTVGHTLRLFGEESPIEHHTLFDAGAGTGYFSGYFKNRGLNVTAGDLAINMLKQAKKNHTAEHYIGCDLEALPFGDHQFCTTFSNLALQWCPDFATALKQLCRITRKRVLFTTLVAGSLHELETTGKNFDGRSRSNVFLPLSTILDGCPKKDTLRWKIQSHVLHYSSLLELFSDLKGTGASYMPTVTTRAPYRRDYLRAFEKIYLRDFGQLQLTYRVFYGVIDLFPECQEPI